MKKIAVIALIITSYNSSFAQETNTGNVEPYAVVTFSKTPTKSPLLVTVLNLCNNDELLTEKVILEISKEKQTKNMRIVNETEYNALRENEQTNAICESHIQAIINRLNSQK